MNRHRLFLIPAVGVTAIAITALAAATASADTVATQASVSQNWAGYVAGGTQFSSVSGSWIQPTARCGSGQTYSAFWVGLGGSGQSSSLEQTGSESSSSLEQTGTQANCDADGSTEYYAWYELVPAAPVKFDLAIHPGDHIAAKVNVSGSDVTMSLTDQTTGQSASKTAQLDSADTSSAEWIAEAPSACDGSGSCQTLPLADFGTVQFTGASATANGHTGPISDPNWSAQPVELGSGGVSDVAYAPDQSAAGAAPTSLSSDGASFSVSYQSSAASGTSGPSGAAGGSGDYGYGNGGYGYGGYPGDGGSYGYGGYPGGYGQYGYGGYDYGYGAF
jgi:Peptidase A4 family